MRLGLSRRTDLATRALLALDELGERTKAADLAELIGTSAGFCTQVLAPLVGRGWVRSEPGPTGGYTVACSIDSLSVLDVIEAIEGPTVSGRCVLENRNCEATGPCALHTPWIAARTLLLGELGSTTLGSLRHPDVQRDRRALGS